MTSPKITFPPSVYIVRVRKPVKYAERPVCDRGNELKIETKRLTNEKFTIGNLNGSVLNIWYHGLFLYWQYKTFLKGSNIKFGLNFYLVIFKFLNILLKKSFAPLTLISLYFKLSIPVESRKIIWSSSNFQRMFPEPISVDYVKDR